MAELLAGLFAVAFTGVLAVTRDLVFAGCWAAA